jgi:CheY-like chemotaxis protein
MFHDREVEAPPDRRNGEQDEPERRQPVAPRVIDWRHGGLRSGTGRAFVFVLTQRNGIALNNFYVHSIIQTTCRRFDLIGRWDVLVTWPPPEEEGIIVPRVLVVDDDPMVCVAIEVCLTRKGFEVTVADGGEGGMRAPESSDFDVMLIDVFMPHMRGFESIRMFHERRPDIPIVAMSGYAFANTERAPDFLRMTIELGVACCLRKPFTPDALLTSVNQYITKPNASARLSK